jgi:diamine N-acetyltransferase
MHLRQATLADLPFVMELERWFHAQGFVGIDIAPVHEAMMASPDCVYIIVEENGAAAGFAILRGLASTHRNIELKRMAIAEPGQGLGRRFLRALQQLVFDQHGAHRLWLDVYPENARARHLYHKLGFVEEGLLRECERAENRYRSLILMSILEAEYRRVTL